MVVVVVVMLGVLEVFVVRIACIASCNLHLLQCEQLTSLSI